MRKLLSVGISALALSAGALAYAGSTAFAPKADTFRQLELFGDVLAIVQQQYVVETDDTKLIDAALNGMLASLDPHSSYLAPTDFNELRETSRGAYGGLGLEVTSEDGAVKIITPMDDTPAARAGVQAGDYITAINGESILGKPLSEAVKSMKGAPGTEVTITIARQGVDPFDLKLTREIINVKSVRSRIEQGKYGVIRITNFNENTGRETAEAVAQLKRDLPNMQGLVLDLRNNPGGILESSVQVADVFLDGGEVVTQRGRQDGDIERYNARPGDELAGVPIVVLVNPGSASAAEIVAGALQDRKRATIVGITSFGKGSVQTVIPLRGGQDGALKLTTARYYTPSGRSIQRTGIEPDLEVALTREQAERLAQVNIFSEASFSNALNADEGKTRRTKHEPSEYPPESFDTKKGDFQLARAFDVIDVKGNLAALKPVPKAKLAELGSTIPGKGEAQPVTGATPGDAPKTKAPTTPAAPGLPDKPQPYQPSTPPTKK